MYLDYEVTRRELTLKRNPTAVQSGNRQAALLGERRRVRRREPSVQVEPEGTTCAEWAEAGPGRKPLAAASARYQRLLSARIRAGPRGDVASHFVGLLVFTHHVGTFQDIAWVFHLLSRERQRALWSAVTIAPWCRGSTFGSTGSRSGQAAMRGGRLRGRSRLRVPDRRWIR